MFNGKLKATDNILIGNAGSDVIEGGAGADFIVVNMVAEAASGQRSPQEAAERAQKRAERYYKV